MQDFDITILIPAKDEAARLPPFLKDVLTFAQNYPGSVEVIVIDDGSSDNTAGIIIGHQNEYPDLKLLRLPTNKGKGYALKRGMQQAQGSVVAFLDADGSTPVDEISRQLKWFEKGADIIIGSRVLTDRVSQVQALTYRKWIGIVFNSIVHAFLIKEIKDTQCGFKMFRQSIISGLIGRIYLNGFGFDLELLYVAKQLGLKIKEVPVNWHHVDGSKVHLIKDSLRMLINIFQIRSWHPLSIQQTHPHMSANELENMYIQEKDHWWFIAKGWFMKNLLKSRPAPKRILDAGCGTGHNALSLKSKSFYVGCDVVSEALQFCQQNQLGNLTQGNLTQLGFKNESFDLILCLDVIEHVDNDRKALLELKRLLAPDGIIALGVPAWRRLYGPHDVALSHMRRYNPRDLKTLIADCGLKYEKMSFWYVIPFLPVYIIRSFRKHFKPSESLQSDTHKPPSKFVNAVMLRLLRLEAWLQQFIPMPFGTTLVALVKRT